MNVEQMCQLHHPEGPRKASWVVIDKTTGIISYLCTFHLVLAETGHTYSIYPLKDYTKNGGHDLPAQKKPCTSSELFNEIDWKLLTCQKLHLLQAIAHLENDDHKPINDDDEDEEGFKRIVGGLNGILHLIDSIQDTAFLDGFDVTFLTEEE